MPIRLLVVALVLIVLPACGSSEPDDGLPPDPGEAGRATLEGIDSDEDGLRDDVQRWIALTYEDEPTRQALTQTARAVLTGLQVSTDREASIDQLVAMTRGIECTVATRGDAARTALDGLREAMVDTEARARAYVALDAHGGGGIFVAADDLAESCTGGV